MSRLTLLLSRLDLLLARHRGSGLLSRLLTRLADESDLLLRQLLAGLARRRDLLGGLGSGRDRRGGLRRRDLLACLLLRSELRWVTSQGLAGCRRLARGSPLEAGRWNGTALSTQLRAALNRRK